MEQTTNKYRNRNPFFKEGDYIKSQETNLLYVVTRASFHLIAVDQIDNWRRVKDYGFKPWTTCIANEDIHGKHKFVLANLSDESTVNYIKDYEDNCTDKDWLKPSLY